MPRNSREKLANMLDSIAEGIYCVDLNGNCTYCNARCLELLGFESEQELLGQNMHDLIHHHHRDGSIYDVTTCKIYDAYHNDRQVHVQDEVFFRKDGERFDAEYWSYPIKENGSVVGAVVSFLDITLKRAESSYRNHLARLVETSPDAIVSRDQNGRITSWNRGAEQIYGFDAEEVIGKFVNELILPPDRNEEEIEILNAIRDGKELLQFEVKRQRRNGEIIDVSLTLSPIWNADQQLIGCSSIERDVTERRKSQDAVLRAMTAAEHAEEMANKANRSRADFLANVSHELRTPMNAILGMLQLSLEEDLDAVVADYLAVAKTSADSLLQLVNELLDFSKIESGSFEISNKEFDLRDTIDAAARSLSTRASEKGLELLCEIDGAIPRRLIGDGRRIQQVLTNLLSNAVKFTEIGEIVISVQPIRELPSEIRLRFTVRDTGIGICEEDQRKILLPFQQADMSSTREQHGTGLGLSICRELVSLMGGQLRLDSTPDEGSSFWFDLSLPVADHAKPADHLPADLVADLKVLIVDDNPTNLRILEKIFVSWSMQPIVTGSAEQAMRVVEDAEAQDFEISIALVDCLMPKVDGFELAEMLAEKKGDDCPPIVMMQSAADLALYSDRKSKAPVSQYLTKPVSQSELLNTVIGTLNVYADSPDLHGLSSQPDLTKSQLIRPLSILLVEDLPANQKVAKAILQKRGHSVKTVSNGRVAVEEVHANESGYDVILMDVQMPVMDGLQATAAIRAIEDPKLAEIPIIAMTAHAMHGDRESCLAAGMDAYLAKPLDAGRMIELVESIVLRPNSQVDLYPLQKNGKVEMKKGDTPIEQSQPETLVDYESSLRRLGGNQDLFLEFIDIFLTDSPGLLEGVTESIENNDAKQLEKSAHALKGMISNFGAKSCCDLALAFEVAGRNGNVETVRNDTAKLHSLYEKLCAELIAYQANG